MQHLLVEAERRSKLLLSVFFGIALATATTSPLSSSPKQSKQAQLSPRPMSNPRLSRNSTEAN